VKVKSSFENMNREPRIANRRCSHGPVGRPSMLRFNRISIHAPDPATCFQVAGSGDNSAVAPPVPIPNTEVKRCSPDGSTAIGRARVGRRQNPSTVVAKGLAFPYFFYKVTPDAGCRCSTQKLTKTCRIKCNHLNCTSTPLQGELYQSRRNVQATSS
jgi:hypothetical protein